MVNILIVNILMVNILIVNINGYLMINNHWLVVDLLWKMMEWVTVGMMKFPTEWNNKKMFQTTNQVSPIFGRSNRCANHSANHKLFPFHILCL